MTQRFADVSDSRSDGALGGPNAVNLYVFRATKLADL
jgi:hypothetical protein